MIQKRNNLNKKGQIPNVFLALVGLGLGLIVFTIFMSIGGDVLTSLQANSQTTTATEVANETNTTRALNSFNLATNVEAGLTGTTVVHNATEGGAGAGDVVPTTNYTVTTVLTVSTLTWNGPSFNDTMVNVSYNFLDITEDVAFNTTGFGLTGVLNIAEFNPTFGTIIVLSGILLLLGAVIGSIIVFRRGAS